MMAMLLPDPRSLLHTKTVRSCDLKGKLAFPVSLMGHLWPAGVVPNHAETQAAFTVLDINLMPWHFDCKVRFDERGNPKPEVSGPDWKRCIREKNIRVGDKLAFYLPPPVPPTNDPPVFLISFKREFRLGGRTSFEHVRF